MESKQLLAALAATINAKVRTNVMSVIAKYGDESTILPLLKAGAFQLLLYG